MRASIQVVFPPHELLPLLVALRTWERGRLEIEWTIAVDARELTVAEMQRILAQLDPPVPVRVVRYREDEGSEGNVKRE